ncbi:MAG: hypothetical protein ACE5HT_15475 [Gemmatimonadales bacterium]
MSEAPASKGLELQQRLRGALQKFEDAIVAREHKKLGTKIPLQQDVDRARDGVMKVVVDAVTKERMQR